LRHLKFISFFKKNINDFYIFFINLTILNFLFSYNGFKYPESLELIFKAITLVFEKMFLISGLGIFYLFSYSLNSFQVFLVQNICLSLLISFFYKKSKKENFQYYFIFTSCTLFVFYIFNYSSFISRISYLIFLFFLVFYQLLKNKLLNINIMFIILIITNIISFSVLRTSQGALINTHSYISIKQLENKYYDHKENFLLFNNNLSNILLSSSDLLNQDVSIQNLKNENGFSLIELNTELYGNNIKSIFFKNTKDLANCLFIYHRGHEANQFLNYDKKLKEILNLNITRKCDVVLLDMIGEGINTSDFTIPTKGGNFTVDVTKGAHVNLDRFYIESKNGKVELTSFMIISQYKVLQYLMSEFNYEQVDLFGFSGGGWSGLFISILIPEINKVILHSGSMPIELDNFYYKNNDPHKEFQSDLFKDFSYFDFYFMISNTVIDNPNRALRLIYSSNDPCCFNNPKASVLQNLISKLDLKNFDIDVLERSQHMFYISDIEKSLVSDYS